MLLELGKLFKGGAAGVAADLHWGVMAWGMCLAAVVGYVSLALLVRALKGRWFWLFGPYCVVVGLAVLCLC